MPGLLLFSIALFWYSSLMNADTPIWMFLLPSALMGIGSAGMWGPLATTATRRLSPRQAGAGAGIYNTTRTIGSVLGSAAIAAFMQARLEANLPGAGSSSSGFGSGQLPAFVVDGFSKAMEQALLLPASIMLIGVVVVLFAKRPKLASATADWESSRTGAVKTPSTSAVHLDAADRKDAASEASASDAPEPPATRADAKRS